MVRWFEKHFFHNIFWEQKLFLEHKFSLDNIFLPTNFSTKIVISNKFLTNKLKKKSFEQLLISQNCLKKIFIKRIIGFEKNKINLFQFFFMDNKQTLFENFFKKYIPTTPQECFGLEYAKQKVTSALVVWSAQ